jgi:hypothetical protein
MFTLRAPLIAHDVPKQPAVLVNAVGRRLRERAHSRSHRKQCLRRARRRASITLDTEVNLRSVDLNEPDPLSVPQSNRVAIDDVIDSIDRRCARSRCDRRHGHEDDEDGER